MLKAAAAFLVLFSLSASVGAADTCTKVCTMTLEGPPHLDIFQYVAGDMRDEAYQNDYPWAVEVVEPIDGQNSCRVYFGLVTEDNPALETLPEMKGGKLENINVGGQWVDFDVFEEQLRAVGCMQAGS